MLDKVPRAGLAGKRALEFSSRRRGSEVCGYLGKSILKSGEKCRILGRDGKPLEGFKQKTEIIQFMLKYIFIHIYICTFIYTYIK